MTAPVRITPVARSLNHGRAAVNICQLQLPTPRTGPSSTVLVVFSMACEPLLARPPQSLSAGLTDGVSPAFVLVVRSDLAEAGVKPDRVVLLAHPLELVVRLEDDLRRLLGHPVFDSGNDGCIQPPCAGTVGFGNRG